MLGFPMLDIVIGLVFVYLLLALICTAINEIIANLLDRRAKYLRQGIERLLEDGPGGTVGQPNVITAKGFYEHAFIKSIYEHQPKGRFPSKLFPRLGGYHTDPSYIPARTFALTLLDLLADHGRLPDAGKNERVKAGIKNLSANPQLKKSLEILKDQAGDDLQKLQDEIERWYTTAMDRVTSWYKQNTQTITIWLALAVTVCVNADTLFIYKEISSKSVLREAFVAKAYESANRPSLIEPTPTPPPTPGPTTDPGKDVPPPPPATGSAAKPPDSATQAQTAEKKTELQAQPDASRLQAIKKEIDSLTLELGWKGKTMTEICDALRHDPQKILGLLLTALAVSLGAPFWFDTLKRLVTIRAAGKSPKELKAESTDSAGT